MPSPVESDDDVEMMDPEEKPSKASPNGRAGVAQNTKTRTGSAGRREASVENPARATSLDDQESVTEASPDRSPSPEAKSNGQKNSIASKTGGDSSDMEDASPRGVRNKDNDVQANGALSNTDANSREMSVKSPVQNGIRKPHVIVPHVKHDAGVNLTPHTHRSALEAENLDISEADLNLTKDTARLREVIGEVSHKAAQKILRENWRNFLFDPPDETHVAFILRAGLKNSTTGILARVIKDDNVFKAPFLEAASRKPGLRKRVIEGITKEELVAHVPLDVLDAVVAARIQSVHVKQLVSWLVKGNRLGYEEDDLISVADEVVVPNVAPRPQFHQPFPGPYAQPPQQGQHLGQGMAMSVPYAGTDPLLDEQNRQREILLRGSAPANNFSAAAPRPAPRPAPLPIDKNGPGDQANQRDSASRSGSMVCSDCGHHFTNLSGYHHHLAKKICTKGQPLAGFKWSCSNCLQGFTTKQGGDYHRMKGVCTGSDILPATEAVIVTLPDALPRKSVGQIPYVVVPVPGSMPGPNPQAPWISHPQYPPVSQPQYPPTSQPQYGPILPPSQIPHQRPPILPPSQIPPRHPPPILSPSQIPQAVPSTPQVRPPRSTIEVAIRSPKTAIVPPIPPLHTPAFHATPFQNNTSAPPTRKQAPRGDVRIDPSELSPERFAALNRELDELDRKHDQGIAEIPAEWDEELRNNRAISLKNANSSRKSQVRKHYGVTLRMREKDKLHRNSMRRSETHDSSSPMGSASSTPALVSGPSSAPSIPRPQFDGVRTYGTGFSPVNASSAPPPPSSAIQTGRPPIGRHEPSPYRPSAASPAPRSNPGGRSNSSSSRSTPLPEPFLFYNPHIKRASRSGSERHTDPESRKRQHEASEHERRPGSGAGGYTGGVPSASGVRSGLSTNGSTGLSRSESEANGTRRSQDPSPATNGEAEASRSSAERNGSAEKPSRSQVIVLDDSSEDEASDERPKSAKGGGDGDSGASDE